MGPTGPSAGLNPGPWMGFKSYSGRGGPVGGIIFSLFFVFSFALFILFCFYLQQKTYLFYFILFLITYLFYFMIILFAIKVSIKKSSL